MNDKISMFKNMGPKWVIYRGFYELRKKTGLLYRKFHPNLFSHDLDVFNHDIFTSNDKSHVLKILNEKKFFLNEKTIQDYSFYVKRKINKEQLEKIDQKNFKLFSYENFNFNNIDWHYSPLTKQKSKKTHWLKISDLNSEFGDIKFIWEPSRFNFTYDLVRAYAQTKDSKYVNYFWAYVDDWIDNNPPEIGVNYRCSQEMAIRLMAWIFGLYSFSFHSNSNIHQIQRLLRYIYLHTLHIDKHFEFSLNSVKNNHTISEAAALYTVGTLFPSFDLSQKWRRKGKKHLEKESEWQIYKDGSYIQNSMNYHRLMLQMYTWSLRIGEINNDNFSENLKEKLIKATYFLYQHQILRNGQLPNYGANDGALVHSFSNSSYLDYRPQINSMWYLLTGKRLYNPGYYDESLYVLFGSSYINAPIEKKEQKSTEFKEGGYFTIRNNGDLGTIRCTTFRNRPSQSDMLHFNLNIESVDVLIDAGSYLYNTKDNIINYFKGSSSHNALMINNCDQMKKIGSFMWKDWTKSKKIHYIHNESYNLFEGEHYGYNPLVHRRLILNINKEWIVIDDLYGDFEKKDYNVELSWLLGISELTPMEDNEWGFEVNSLPYKIKVITPKKASMNFHYGSADPFRGWVSQYYGSKEARPQLSFKVHSDQKVRFITVVSRKENDITYTNNNLFVGDNVIKLNQIEESQIVRKINEDVL